MVTQEAIGALPCPFCGGTDLHIEGDANEGLWGVECDNPDCGASGPRGFETPRAAVAAWNRRLFEEHPGNPAARPATA